MQPAVSRRGFLGGALLAGGAGLVPRLASAAPDGAVMYPHVAALAAKYVDSGTLPGVVALIGFGESQSAVMRGVQTLGDPHPADLDSLYRAYSMTKPITGMIAMMLIDEGKLGLDQPVSDILPKYARMMVQVTPDGSMTDLRPAKTAITIRHLLTHTSGLGYSITQKGPIKDAYEAAGLVPAQVGRKPLPGLTVAKTLPSLAAFADTLATMPLVYEPGTMWSYSVSLDLLGRVIEVVAGKPFDQVMAERIFGPCGMTSSGFRVVPGTASHLTTNYAIVDHKLVPIDPAATSVYLDPPAYPFGGAGLVTSPRDYDRFLKMLTDYGMVGGTRVMSEHAIRLGTSDLLPPALVSVSPYGEPMGFGAGGRVGQDRDAGIYGWSGAAGTVGFVSFRTGMRAGLWVQFMPSRALPIEHEFGEAIRADLTHAKMPEKIAA